MLGLTFRQLQVFVEVVDLGSFRTCAERLGVTQVSVSGHIRAMERVIGHDMFQRRRGASSELTDEGHRVYDHAVLLLQQLQGLVDDVNAVPESKRRCRLIVAGPSYVSYRLTQVFADFSLRHSDLQILHEPTDASASQAAELVQSGQADVCFALSPATDAPARGLPLWQERLGLYVGREHPLAGRRCVEPAEICHFPLIQLPKSDPLRRVVDASLRAACLAGNPVSLHTTNAMLVRRTLTQGKDLGCLFSHLVQRDLERGTLLEVSLKRELLPLQVSIFTSERVSIQRAVASLIALVREEVAGNSSKVPIERTSTTG